ncbi:MAG TPA: SIS domain-containing protein [Candidatus Acidoferrum sp.]|jgi:glucosamine--fructose-6-phosphate aminotransferase (isomerizing)
MFNNDGQHPGSHTWNELISQGEVWQAVLSQLDSSSTVETILTSCRKSSEWVFVGCGTSYYLAEAAALSWTTLTGQRAMALPASEILLFPKSIQAGGKGTQAVVISRSGKTSEAVRVARVLVRQLHVPTIGITCAQGSPLEKECDRTIILQAADEQSTVMTRSFTSMLISLQYLAARHANNRAFVEQLAKAAQHISQHVHKIALDIERFVADHSFDDYIFLGQGPWHGIAREGALKVMEMSCSYSQVFHTLEFRHGPKAIVSENTCLFFFLDSAGLEAESEVLIEMKALGGVIVAIGNRVTEQVRSHCDLVIVIDAGLSDLALLAACTVPCQLMGFFTGLGKGLNPDAPKNLSRVVILD